MNLGYACINMSLSGLPKSKRITTNRSMIKKYVSGMVNPYDQSSMLAANADDKFEAHVLSETGIVVRNPLSCGILSVS